MSLNPSEPFNTLFNAEYTYQFSKYSCVRQAWYAHIVFNYFVTLAGLGCFLTRMAPPQYKWMHSWFGRIYIISMIWSIATSLLIHNTGLPLAVLWSFVWVLLFMCMGWVIIVLHKQKMEAMAILKVQVDISKGGSPANLEQQIQKAKGMIANAKTFKERLFSYKAAHGILMFTSWINIVGRIFASNQSGDFTCYTYPVYKSIDTPHGSYANQTSPTLVSIEDPEYFKQPWARMGVPAWAVALSIGPMAAAIIFGALSSYFAGKGKPGVAGERKSSDHSNTVFTPESKEEST